MQPDQFFTVVVRIRHSRSSVYVEFGRLVIGQDCKRRRRQTCAICVSLSLTYPAVEVKLDDDDGRMDAVVVRIFVSEAAIPDKVRLFDVS